MENVSTENETSHKPKQVTQAFYLLLVSSTISLLVFLANAILQWEEYYASQTRFLFCWGILYVIPFWIAFQINAGRNWARLIFAVMTVISLAGIPGLISGFSDYPVQSTFSAISFALSLFALYLLFQRPSRNWFKVRTAALTVSEEEYTKMVSSMPALSVRQSWDSGLLLNPHGILAVGALVGALVGGTSYSVPLHFIRDYACGYSDAPIATMFPVGAVFGAICVFITGVVFLGRSTDKKRAAIQGVLVGCAIVLAVSLGCSFFSSMPDCMGPVS